MRPLESNILNQAFSIVWVGDEEYGDIVPAGIYFCVLECNDLKICAKVIKCK
ncbi:MAG: hypothetical protein ACPL28_06485 [bacterium]